MINSVTWPNDSVFLSPTDRVCMCACVRYMSVHVSASTCFYCIGWVYAVNFGWRQSAGSYVYVCVGSSRVGEVHTFIVLFHLRWSVLWCQKSNRCLTVSESPPFITISLESGVQRFFFNHILSYRVMHSRNPIQIQITTSFHSIVFFI